MINKYLKKSIDVRKGEGKRTLLMFFYLFFTIASLLIIKPIRNTLIISESGVDKLPYAFILVAISSALFTIIYTRYSRKYKLYYLIKLNLVVSIVIVLLSRFILQYELFVGYFNYFFYVWVGLFGLVTTMQFWLLANYLYHARQAKRIFGILAAGGIAGGIFGGYLTRSLAALIGTVNLLYICVLFLVICFFIVQMISKILQQASDDTVPRKTKVSIKDVKENPFKLILNSNYLLLIALLIGISVVVANLVDFQFNEIASRKINNADDLTAFFGFWLSNLSVISLLIQVFFTTRILKTFGVNASLYFLPAGILIGAIAILFSPFLWAAVLIKVNEGSTKQSVNKSALELLSIPIPEKVKEQTKVVLDVFVDNLATGLGGILLILLTVVFGLSTKYISIITIALIFVWIVVIVLLKKEYIATFRSAIETRSIDFENLSVELRDANIYGSLINSLESKNERQINYVLNLFEKIPDKKFVPQFIKLLDHPSKDIQTKVLQICLEDETITLPEDKLQKMLSDRNENVRTYAMLHYLNLSRDNQIDILKEMIFGDDFVLSQTALLCTAMLSKKDSSILEQINLRDVFDNYRNLRLSRNYSAKENQLMRINAGKILGLLQNKNLNTLLNLMIEDDDLKVRREAIKSAGKIGDPRFIKLIFNHVNTKKLRRITIESLALFGEETVNYFKDKLDDSLLPTGLRLIIPRILGKIPTQSSIDLIFRCLSSSDRLLQYNAIRALQKLDEKYPHLDFHVKELDTIIHKKIRYNFLIGFGIEIINRNLYSVNDTKQLKTAYELLLKILYERQTSDIGRVFRLLSVRYEAEAIINAYHSIISHDSALKENAIEYLENILIKDKEDLVLLVDNPEVELYRRKAMEYFGVDSTITSIFEEFLKGDDGLISASILYIKQYSDDIKYSEIAEFVKSDNPVLRDTAQTIYKIVG